MRYSICLIACVAALGGTTAIAQDVEVEPETAIVQISAPVDRAAGNGSMGMGDGLRVPAEEPRRPAGETDRSSEGADLVDQDADAGHGGNETDMEHRRRPRLGDDRD